MTDKVVAFPKSKIVREVPPNIEEIEKSRERGKQKFAEDIVEDFIGNMIDALEGYGIDTDGNDFPKDFSLTIESLRGTIYRSLGLQHHLHDFVDRCVDVIPLENGRSKLSVEQINELVIQNAKEREELDKE